MSVAALEHPHLSLLLGDPEIAACFSARREVEAMLAFEVALAEAGAEVGEIARDAVGAIAAAVARFAIDDRALAVAAARDGLIVPELVRQLKAEVGPPHDRAVHKGATSQDVIDTGLMLRLRDVVRLLLLRHDAAKSHLDGLMTRHGAKPLMGRTRMQVALPITFGHRLSAWRAGLDHAETRLRDVAPGLLVVQFGGAVGTRSDYGPRAADIEARIADRLGLGVAPQGAWHTARGRVIAAGEAFAAASGAAGKIGMDVALMAQNELAELRVQGAGTSSVMAHKQNPVKAEVLVSLARFAAGLVGTLHQAYVAEQERSGMAWTLEWLVLPQLAVAAGASLRLTAELLAAVDA